jgi:hypothetical protein
LQIIHLLRLLHTLLSQSHFQSFKWILLWITWTTNANIQKIFVPTFHNHGIKRAKASWIKKRKNKWINGITSNVARDIQTKRPYQSIWEFQEIQSKRDKFMASWDVINPSDQMKTTSKWKSCYWALTFVKEWMAYKDKWGATYMNFACLTIWQELGTILNIKIWLFFLNCS